MSSIIQEVPEGEYIVEIADIQSFIDNRGRKVVMWMLEILDGPFAGNILPKKYYMVNQKVADLLKRELRAIGVEACNSQELDAKKAEAIGTRFRLIALTNDQGFRAYYVKEHLGKWDKPKEPPAAAAAAVVW